MLFLVSYMSFDMIGNIYTRNMVYSINLDENLPFNSSFCRWKIVSSLKLCTLSFRLYTASCAQPEIGRSRGSLRRRGGEKEVPLGFRFMIAPFFCRKPTLANRWKYCNLHHGYIWERFTLIYSVFPDCWSYYSVTLCHWKPHSIYYSFGLPYRARAFTSSC